MIGIEGGLDAIIKSEPIRIFLLAVAAPGDAGDGEFFRKFEFDPPFSAFVGNPTVAVAVFAVVQMFETMKVRVGKDTGGAGLGAGSGESDICSGSVVNFEFIDARFSVGGASDGEAQKSGRDRGEAVNVSASADGSAQERLI